MRPIAIYHGMRRAILLGLFIIVNLSRATAGPLPMPLEVDLDMARHIVTGRLTQINDSNVQNGICWGRATVEVKEILKGAPAKTIDFLVVSYIEPNYGGPSILHVNKVGDSGIWLIGRERIIDLLPEEHKGTSGWF